MPTREFPIHHGPADNPQYTLNTPHQSALSEYVRRTKISLPGLIELFHGQSPSDTRPNKNVLPAHIEQSCKTFDKLPQLPAVAREGIHVTLSSPLPTQTTHPLNHPSARTRLNILRKNIRKEQDMGRCLVLDLDLVQFWPELFLSPFGVVDKGDGDPTISGRVIHNLSFPEDNSVNSHTDHDSVPPAEYEHCDAIAREILAQSSQFPNSPIKILLGDVAAAFRNLGTHSKSAHMFAGTIPEDNALVIDLSAGFGWTGSPGFYGLAGGAIAHIHGSTTNAIYPNWFFNYHWVDDHVCISADIGSSFADVEQSLRRVMTTILGPNSVNDDEFTTWDTRQKVLGLVFDTATRTVAMPPSKILKAITLPSKPHPSAGPNIALSWAASATWPHALDQHGHSYSGSVGRNHASIDGRRSK